MGIINLNICLSDIDKSKIYTSDKNGKKYINITVALRKEPDQYGNTHTSFISQSKEDRESGANKVYIGSGKEYIFNQPAQNNPSTQTNNSDEDDDLPF